MSVSPDLSVQRQIATINFRRRRSILLYLCPCLNLQRCIGVVNGMLRKINRVLFALLLFLVFAGLLLRWLDPRFEIRGVISITEDIHILPSSTPKKLSTIPNLKPSTERDVLEKYDLCSDLNGSAPLDLRRVCSDLHLAQQRYYKPRTYKVNPLKYAASIEGKGVCNERTKMLIVADTDPKNFLVRSAVRETWAEALRDGRWPGARLPSSAVVVVFFSGLDEDDTWNINLQREADIHQDIVQLEVQEGIQNKTRKSLLMLRWVQGMCPHAKYIVKAADNTIVNVPLLLKTLQSINFSKSIMGKYLDKVPATRSARAMGYPFYYYPRFVDGAAYVISADILKSLINTSEYLKYVDQEDVYITGILGKILSTKQQAVGSSHVWMKKSADACDLRNNWTFTGTDMTWQKLRKVWQNMTSSISC